MQPWSGAAFELARARHRKLTAVHKDTVFNLGCGMFAEECRKLAEGYSDVEYKAARSASIKVTARYYISTRATYFLGAAFG